MEYYYRMDLDGTIKVISGKIEILSSGYARFYYKRSERSKDVIIFSKVSPYPRQVCRRGLWLTEFNIDKARKLFIEDILGQIESFQTKIKYLNTVIELLKEGDAYVQSEDPNLT